MTSVLFLVILYLGITSSVSESDPNLDIEWNAWKIEFEKSYSLVGNLKPPQKGPRVQVSQDTEVIDAPPQPPSLRADLIKIFVSRGQSNSIFLCVWL